MVLHIDLGGDTPTATNVELLGLDRAELTALLADLGEPAFRAKQVYHALYHRRVRTIDDIHELPKTLRGKLAPDTTVSNLTLSQSFRSEDGTQRYLFTLRSGEAIEAVWIPDGRRATICLSSQAGCPLACDFCLTARLGLKRNLSPGEIVGQIAYVLRDQQDRLKEKDATLPPINLVLMGMGEPLLNYANVMKALRLVTDEAGMNIRPRHITLSTAGIVPRIGDLGKEPATVRPRLAISLSAPNDELRDKLMPINTRWPLAELMRACTDYPLAPGERMTFEYVMLDGVNDRDEHAYQILKLLAPLRARDAAKVNLIPHNTTAELPFVPSAPRRIEAFQNILKGKGLPTFVRRPRGRDITAACGQLAATAGK